MIKILKLLNSVWLVPVVMGLGFFCGEFIGGLDENSISESVLYSFGGLSCVAILKFQGKVEND